MEACGAVEFVALSIAHQPLRMGVKGGQRTGECSRWREIIGIEPADQCPPCSLEGLVEGIDRAAIAAACDPHTRVALSPALEVFKAAIGGATVGDYSFQILRLSEH